MAEHRPAPVVTIRGGPAAPPPRPAPPHLPLLLPLLVALALAVVVAGTRGQAPAVPPASPVDVRLALAADGLSVSQTGMLVVPVVVQDGGPGHRVVSAQAYGSPVRTDPAVAPPRVVEPGQARRFVVILAPDCRLLSPRAGLAFGASLLLQVASGETSEQLVLDLGRDPQVAATVRSLCWRG